MEEGEGGSPTKPPFVPKPPKRHRKGSVLTKRKKSIFNWESARDTLGLGHDIHPRTVNPAATASNGNAAAASTIINSPSKEEVKAENKMLKEQADTLERKIGTLESSNITSKRKVECLQTNVKSLSGSLKTEKIKSRCAIEQLLMVTTTQHDMLLSTFHDKISHIEEEHAISLRKFSRYNKNMAHDNQKSINQLKKRHAKEIKTLSNEYIGDLTQMENKHNKMMVSSCECIRGMFISLLTVIYYYYYYYRHNL